MNGGIVEKLIMLIKEVGFPIAITVYLLYRLDAVMIELIASMTKIVTMQELSLRILERLAQ